MTSFQWRHRFYVTKPKSQEFFIFLSPSQSKFLATPVLIR